MLKALVYAPLLGQRGHSGGLHPVGLRVDCGKWRHAVIKGNERMKAARGFVEAYGHRLEVADRLKLTITCQVIIALHACLKRAPTRLVYDTPEQICAAMYTDFQAKDAKVPVR